LQNTIKDFFIKLLLFFKKFRYNKYINNNIKFII